MRPLENNPGICDRKIGMKSARPSATGFRSSGPTKKDTDRKRSATSGAANGAGPDVCR
jgi:hypothetical protein